MSTVAIALPHLKIHGFAGDHLLERCEDPGCTVDVQGTAACGRLACPSCGFSGSNVMLPATVGADTVAGCSCGHAWIPDVETARAAA